MSGIAQSPAPARVDLSVLRSLQKTEELTDRFAPVIAVALVLVFALWAWFASNGARYQFDELLEISAASAPTNQQVLSFLASGVDFNPPLSHFLVRGSMLLFGNTEWAARLPAFLGMVGLLICLYAILSQQLSRTYGILGMLTILCLPVRDYAVQARPYGLVLGLSGVAVLLFRYAAQRRHRTVALFGLAGCTAALVASHYYAVLVVGVLLAAELASAWERKRPDWAVLVCCAGPPLVVLYLLRDAMRQQRQQLAHYFSRGNLLSFNHGYDLFAMDPLIYCVSLILIMGALALTWERAQARFTGGHFARVQLKDGTLGIGLLLLPIAGAFLTQFVTHAYVPRYFLPAAIGFAMCLCYCVRVFSRVLPGLAVLLVLPLALGFGKAVLQEVTRPTEKLPSIEALTAEQTPLLFDTPANYAQIYYYFPALRSNMWVITDPSASLRYRNYDTDDKIMLALAKHGSAQTISLRAAVRRWQHFRLVPRSADYIWALKCVMDAGSQIQVKHPFGNANFIFDVSVTPEQFSQIDACAP